MSKKTAAVILVMGDDLFYEHQVMAEPQLQVCRYVGILGWRCLFGCEDVVNVLVDVILNAERQTLNVRVCFGVVVERTVNSTYAML